MKKTTRWMLAPILVLTLAGAGAASDDTDPAVRKLLARRAAEADCYRRLAESVYGLEINAETFVRDFVAESDEIRAAVDTVITGVRLGSPRYLEDGTCEIDAELPVDVLTRKLKEIHAVHYHGRSISITDIERIEEHAKTKIIRVTGSGAPRPDLPPELPLGAETAITPLPTTIVARRDIPPIWTQVGGQARLLAQRAAELDAMRKLLERIKGVRITSDTLVRDFVAESDEIRARADGLVRGASVARTYLHRDELIAEVTMEIPVDKVVSRIRELHSEFARHGRITTTDVTNIEHSLRRDVIRATGAGVPPPHFLRESGGMATAPPWVGKRFRATGEATDPSFDSAQGRLRAHRAARVIAMRNLLDQVRGLSIRTDTTIGDLMTRHDDLRLRLDGTMSGAVEESVEFGATTVRVTVSLPGAAVWSVAHERMPDER